MNSVDRPKPKSPQSAPRDAEPEGNVPAIEAALAGTEPGPGWSSGVSLRCCRDDALITVLKPQAFDLRQNF
ncbi:MAG: hypothetical protein HY290_05745 [Planctomycetia bacterium]|nr:hypothetical protein [Planctomycetia bacterium]